MPSSNPKIKKALKDGVISQKQYDKLSDGLLLGIIQKKMKGGKVHSAKKGEKVHSAKKGEKVHSAKKGGGVKEERHKLGKQAHKAGRPKGGSKVKIAH